MHPSLNPRVVKEADTLAEAGCEVVLVAPDYDPWARQADKAFAAKSWRIVARPCFGPFAPFPARCMELAGRGLAKIALGLGSRSMWAVHSHVHAATPGLVKAASAVVADLYIGHTLPGLAAVAIAARNNHVPFGFDAEDFHAGDLAQTEANTSMRDLIMRVERTYLKNTAYMTAAAPLIADAYHEAYGVRRPRVVLNVFPRKFAPARPSRVGRRSERSIYWFSQTIGRERGLELLVAAVARTKSRPRIVLRGKPDQGFINDLLELAATLGVYDCIDIREPAPPSEMERLAVEHDLGFAGETGHSPNRQIMLTNKQFTYLLSGLPVIMSDIPSHRAFSTEAEGAVILFENGNAESLSAAIDHILLDTERLQRASVRAWRLGQERFNWDVEKTQLLQAVQGVLNLPPQPSKTGP